MHCTAGKMQITWDFSNALHLREVHSKELRCWIFFKSCHPRKVNGILVGEGEKEIGLNRRRLWVSTGASEDTFPVTPGLKSPNLMQISTESLCILPIFRVKHTLQTMWPNFTSRCMFTSSTQCLPLPSAPQSTWPWLSQWRGLKSTKTIHDEKLLFWWTFVLSVWTRNNWLCFICSIQAGWLTVEKFYLMKIPLWSEMFILKSNLLSIWMTLAVTVESLWKDLSSICF